MYNRKKSYDDGRAGLPGGPSTAWGDHLRGEMDRRHAQITGQGGEGSGTGILLLPIILAIPFLTALLYPIPSLAALATVIATVRILPSAMTSTQSWIATGLIGLATFWGTSRLDHRAADRWRFYYWLRHLARLAIFGFGAPYAIEWSIPRTWTWFDTHFGNSFSPARIGLIVLTLVIVHWVLTRDTIRDTWHATLGFTGLRPYRL